MERINNFIDILNKLKNSYSFKDIKEELKEAMYFLSPEQLYIAEEEMIECNIPDKYIKLLISECLKNISLKNSQIINSLDIKHPIKFFLKEHEEIISILEELKIKSFELKKISEIEKNKNLIEDIKKLIYNLNNEIKIKLKVSFLVDMRAKLV